VRSLRHIRTAGAEWLNGKTWKDETALKSSLRRNERWTALVLCLCLAFPGGRALAEGGEDETGGEPVALETSADLLAIGDDPFGNYVLAADIDMKDVDWTPVPFSGTFDGNGHTIYNLAIRRTGDTSSITYDGRHRGYHTYYAALFSVTKGATIRDLHLLNVTVDVTTDAPCFAAGIAGSMADTEIAGCSVEGRIALNAAAGQCGVGGIAGYGCGTITDCDADVTLTIIAVDPDVESEEFLGGVLASGYADVDGCSVRLDGYASVHGYAHNGGLIGMDDVNSKTKIHWGYVRNCMVDAAISFFEDTEDRRAYCKPYIGEKQNEGTVLSNNTTIRFESNESKDFSRPLQPEMCENPVYDAVVTPPGCTTFGYTTYTCESCGYSYTDDYTAPAHTPGEWEIVTPATYESEGLKQQFCTVCGELLAEETIPRLIPVSSCTLNETGLKLAYRSSETLRASVVPADASDPGVVWSSSDETVARVDDAGVVTAVGAGTAEITCQSSDGFASSACAIEVFYTFRQKLIRTLLFGWLWY